MDDGDSEDRMRDGNDSLSAPAFKRKVNDNIGCSFMNMGGLQCKDLSVTHKLLHLLDASYYVTVPSVSPYTLCNGDRERSKRDQGRIRARRSR